ncbi:MAG: phosphatidate cytidylyltransferase [Bacillota bacterium]
MFIRTVVGVMLVGLLAAVLFFDGLFRTLAFTAFALMSVHEMKGMLLSAGVNTRSSVFAYVYAAGFYASAQWLGVEYSLALLAACVIGTIVQSIFDERGSAAGTLYSLSVFVYPLMSFVFLMLLCHIKDRGLSMTGLLLTFAGPLAGDTLAYFIGVLFGKRPLCPRLSPKKTVEGAIAGVCGGALGGVITYYVQSLWGGTVGLLPLALIGLCLGALGQTGDLFASSLKRWANVKDFGIIFPGHGGVLDRIDSVLVCVPVVYLCFYLLFGLRIGI